MRIKDANEHSLKQLLDLHDDAVVLIDDQYTIVAANSAYIDSFCGDTIDPIGSLCHQVSHRSQVPCHVRGEDCPLQRVKNTGKAVDTLHIHFNADRAPERVRVQGFPVMHNGQQLLAEKIQRLDSNTTAVMSASQQMVGQAPIFLNMMHRLVQAAAMPGCVLLQGESGAGKELAAHFMHEHSPRKNETLVVADCASIPEPLLESELFGHEKGSFTGSTQAHAGLLEKAHGGSLLLNDIGELPLPMQAKLLRAIDSGRIRRLGAVGDIVVDVRFIAASHRDLLDMADQNEFRTDLYYRLATHEVLVPSVHQRKEDIRLLCVALLARMFPRTTSPRLLDDAVHVLETMPLRGNVRELRNLLERASAFGAEISAVNIRAAEHSQRRAIDDTRTTFAQSNPPVFSTEQVPTVQRLPRTSPSADRAHDVKSMRAAMLAQSLRRHDGNRARAAADLGVSERTVYRWMQHFCKDPNCNW